MRLRRLCGPALLQRLQKYGDAILRVGSPGLAQQSPQILGQGILLGERRVDHRQRWPLAVVNADQEMRDDDLDRRRRRRNWRETGCAIWRRWRPGRSYPRPGCSIDSERRRATSWRLPRPQRRVAGTFAVSSPSLPLIGPRLDAKTRGRRRRPDGHDHKAEGSDAIGGIPETDRGSPPASRAASAPPPTTGAGRP